MSPSYTCYTARGVLKNLGSSIRTTNLGHPIDPVFPDANTLDAEAFRSSWCAYNLTRKLSVKPDKASSSIDLPAEKALSDFLEREQQNAELNRGEFPSWVLPYLLSARQICEDLIGEKPDMDRVYRNSVFTGGASTSRKRSESHPALKWWARSPLDVTPQAKRHLVSLMQTCETLETAWLMPGCLSCTTYDMQGWKPFFNIVPGSRFDTVDKNFGVKRTILIEPDGNMLIQRGVGITLRELLLKVGIDLRKQENNQHHAKLGALLGDRATLDVRDASNSLYRMLFCMVLPDEWYELLLDLRSPLTKMPDGTWHKLEMISSMGNGYTFELETLLFYCLCQAVNKVEKINGVVAVYGDDIVVATPAARPVIALFDAIGIYINKEKSFWSGPFRESCGEHYHGGVNVTPIYMRSELDNDSSIFHFLNQLHFWLTADYTVAVPDAYTGIFKALLGRLKRRPQIPLEYSSDSGLYSPLYSDVIRVKVNRHGSVMALFTTLRPEKVGKCRAESELAWLYQHVTPQISQALYHVPYESFLERCMSLKQRSVLDLRRMGELVYKTVAIPLVGSADLLRQ